MAKIDVTQIEGYDSMSAEDKIKALEAFEYEDNQAELNRLKNSNTKANAEAADWKRKYQEKLSEGEKKEQEEKDKYSKMEEELAELRKDKVVQEFKANFLAQGYSEELAAATAKAMADGDNSTVFANQKKFLEEHDKALKAEALKQTPKPPAGEGSHNDDYSKLIQDATAAGDMTRVAYYTRLQAEAEASANQK